MFNLFKKNKMENQQNEVETGLPEIKMAEELKELVEEKVIPEIKINDTVSVKGVNGKFKVVDCGDERDTYKLIGIGFNHSFQNAKAELLTVL